MQDEYGNEIPAPTGGERVGFCQDCGKPLTAETVRTVGSGVFCEPCLEARVGAAGQPVGYGVPPVGAGPAAGFVPPVSIAHAPSPVLAGFLGLIPGVGAMYNGQFAKGIVHLVIFFVLTSLEEHANGVFGLFVFGWICYMSFEAYHTAKARLEGLPLPNAFGFNDIGERMGFGKSWPGSATRPPVNPPVTQWTPTATPGGQPIPQAGPFAPVPPVPPANWAGYVPPTHFATPQTVVPPVDPVAQAAHASAWSSSPYTAPVTPRYDAVGTVPVQAANTPTAPSRKFPVGAIWLIALGVLFSLANLDSHFHVSGLWLSAAVLAGLAIWMLVHRLSNAHRDHPEGLTPAVVLSCVLRWPPVVLMVLAVLFGLQAADLFTLGQTWPAILIAFGAMLLLERAVPRTPYVVPPPAAPPAWMPEPPVTGAPIPVSGDATTGGSR
jgi:hypothetical protein